LKPILALPQVNKSGKRRINRRKAIHSTSLDAQNKRCTLLLAASALGNGKLWLRRAAANRKLDEVHVAD
jgi:hypothetical protein